MELDLLITGATVVTPEGTRRVAVGIADGRIALVAPEAELGADPEGRARKTLHAAGLHLLPGVIDTHTHARDPSRNEREDFTTATAAAAAGGITTILEMPISSPSVHDRASLETRAAAVEPRAIVDFGLYAGAADDDLPGIAEAAAAGAIAYKTFRNPPPPGREAEFVGLCAPEPAGYYRALEAVARTGLRSTVHAEDATMIARNAAELRAAGRGEPITHALSRPPVVEQASVAQSLELARAAGARIGIAHCSTPTAVDLVTRARSDGVDATVETCPHYLFLTEAEIERSGPYAKINPALRRPELVAGLWERVVRGEVDYLGSDHSPFLVEEKEPFWEDMWGASPGAPGLESLLPLMLTAVAEGRITLERMVELTAGTAARVFGLPAKGAIRVGADADLVLVDLARPTTIEVARWRSKSRGTARIWDGRPVAATILGTWVRGRAVWREGELLAGPGWGRWLRPAR